LNAIQFGYLVMATDNRSRGIRRERFLSAFSELPVDFFGTYPAEFARRFRHATFHGGKPFADVVAFGTDTKIALCETVNWRRNAHLRLLYAYAGGGLAAAERNVRLSDDFTDMKDIVFLEHSYDEDAEKVVEILADPAHGQEMADAARPLYEERYTWRRTVG